MGSIHFPSRRADLCDVQRYMAMFGNSWPMQSSPLRRPPVATCRDGLRSTTSGGSTPLLCGPGRSRGEGVFLLVQRRQVDGVARLEKEIVVLRRSSPLRGV